MRHAPPALDALLWLAIAALLSAIAFRMAKFSPLTFVPPKTVISNSEAKSNEPFLLFLAEVSARVPKGATFSIVPPGGRDPSNWLDYMVAVGQLPGRRVIFAPRFLPPGTGAETPRFVACYRGTFSDSRFRRVRRFPEGDLYEAAP